MTDAPSEAVRATLDDPFAQLSGNLAGTRRLQFEVAGSRQLTPHMQRLELTAAELDGFSYAPGQDVMLLVAADGNRPVRRRYTIRHLDRAQRQVTLDVVLHGEGPGERWVRAAKPGDRIEGIGPRGKITTSPAADWHLFIGDESALPAIGSALEALPPNARGIAYLEAQDSFDLIAPPGVELIWIDRAEPGTSPHLLADAVLAGDWRPGRVDAFAHGERESIKAVRAALKRRDLGGGGLSISGYWAYGRVEDQFQAEKREPIGQIDG